MRRQDTISYQLANMATEEVLKRWLLWAMKGDVAEKRIKQESMGNKKEILRALVWIGAIG